MRKNYLQNGNQENLIQNQLGFTKNILNVKTAYHYLGISKSPMYKLSKNLLRFSKADLDTSALSNPISTLAEISMSASQHILKNNPLTLN